MLRNNSLAELKNYLIKKGFHEYPPTPYQLDSNVYSVFQKCYSDNVGKKFFIDAKIYDFSSILNYEFEKYVMQYDGQFYAKGTHDAINMEFLSMEIEQVEEFLDKMFQADLIEYYEVWDV